MPLETDVDEAGDKTVITVKRWCRSRSVSRRSPPISARKRAPSLYRQPKRTLKMSKRMAKARTRMAARKA